MPLPFLNAGGAPGSLWPVANLAGTPYALSQGVGGSPVTILGASLLGWWTADRADLFTLSGAQVSAWRDVVAGYELSQAIGGSRPLFSATSFNGAPGVTLDGSDDELTLASTPFPTGANPCEVWAIVQQDTAVGDATLRRLFSYGGNSANTRRTVNRALVGGVNRANITAGTGAAEPTTTNTNVDFSSRHMLRAQFTGTAIPVDVDGVAAAAPTAAVPATGTTRTRMGANTGDTALGFYQGIVRDLLVTLPLSTDVAAALQAWALPRRRL